MSGARAAMHEIFATTARQEPTPGEIASLAALAAEARTLIEAVVHTALPAGDLAELTAQLAAINARLASARTERPPRASIGADGMMRALGSPVTGILNPIAPPIVIHTREDGSVYTEYTLSDVYEGPPTFVHGGVSALILDHLLGSAAAANGTPGMTATLDLRYRRPTPHGVPLLAEAHVTRSEGRKTWATATITAPNTKVTIEATAMFIFPR
ncbi:PaaI family thioesterase [Actinocorallia lasiicapitis]